MAGRCRSSLPDKTQTAGDIRLAAGETVTCVFTNATPDRIGVKVVTEPAGNGQEFGFYGKLNGKLTDGGMLFREYAPDGQTWSVREQVPAGWKLKSVDCREIQTTQGGVSSQNLLPSRGNLEQNEALIGLDAGEVVLCVFTNERMEGDGSGSGEGGQYDPPVETKPIAIPKTGFPAGGVTICPISRWRKLIPAQRWSW